MKHSIFRLSRPLKGSVYLSSGALLLTGAGWMLLHDRVEEGAWARVPRLLLEVHGGAAMGTLLVLGAVTLHVKRGWKASVNRVSGALLVALNMFLIVTGYGLYYAADERWREWLSRWHGWMGLGLFAILPAHVIAGRWIVKNLPHDKAKRVRDRQHPQQHS